MSDQREGGIAWTDQTWNPVRGCSRVSEGCRHCYAESMAARFSGPGQPYEGLALRKKSGPAWTGEVRFVAEHLGDPIRWKRPRRVFVNSMNDLFHEKVSNEQIAAVFGVMASAPQHTFQVLTKRPKRMVEWFKWAESGIDSNGHPASWYPFGVELGKYGIGTNEELRQTIASHPRVSDASRYKRWPLPNVWLGVSTENQATADERVPLLLQTPAAVRFVSAEPLLGPIDFEAVPLPDAYFKWKGERGVLQPLTAKETEPDDYTYFSRLGFKLDWVIVGGESGNGARACEVGWIRSIVEQCKDAGTACFVKQIGGYPILDPRYIRPGNTRRLRDRKGGDMAEWPGDLMVREFPAVRP